MVNSATNTPTATLFYGVHPEDGSRAAIQVLFKPDPVTGENYKKNFTYEEKTAVIENVRGKEGSVSLDTTGFQYYNHPTKLTADDFSDEATVVNKYYPETIETIKKLTGASRVVIFDHSQSPHPPRSS